MKVLILFFVLLSFSSIAQTEQVLKSPDGKIAITVSLGDQILYTVKHENDVIIAASPISMKLSTGETLGSKPKLSAAKRSKTDQAIEASLYKRKKIQDSYNELKLTFKGDYGIIFRAYNDGAAYRFTTSKKKDFNVVEEQAAFSFSSDYTALVPYVKDSKPTYEEQFWNSFENTYTSTKLSAIDSKRLIFLPLLVDVAGKKVCITEADLEEYPGMYLVNKDGSQKLTGVFAPYPKTVEQGGHNKLQLLVKERENFIAKVKGTRAFPWRVMVIAAEDRNLADSDIIYKLAAPSRVADAGWIKPGKVAWDWWNDWNIYGVDFKAGINNDTYKYYIDFASANNIEYVILDEGWAVNLQADLMQVVPEINVKELVDYGKQKNVGIILWAGYYAFDRDMEKVCKHYSEMGVKGFKVDFMDRDDQEVVNFYYRAAEMGAKYKMLIDFHGAFKPTGLQRTYPNVINFEGVHGLEQLKWGAPSIDMVEYDVTIPFIRMVAGPMDYTQGAMRNATKHSYRPVNSDPMSQGTRCHQLAEYVIFESPLNMLCDNPSNYMREPECTKFIASVPTTWDDTRALDGRVGEFVAIARQKGNDWYVGAITDWNARELTLDLSFLPNGNYNVELFKDGVNAHRAARDFKQETITLDQSKKIKVSLAPGGGFVAKISVK
ncbi:glycoside hydrolase family 97 protein [Chryseosolibacter indicus]|uniref:Glycoside hydrolase family 97 catalytic domain-containing protein n=1 Tax=Chryseosolibacter indicus TaxID=2782351 RepID=A0ABS5VLQ2_9BACT|nr:glycoside hydrolase family 97 protein [Chryseosolibacter indicus]MBT1702306.1 glycoside hydrolase family 97 catalytic domain-containing protein [Chryseosolibacter indicus]